MMAGRRTTPDSGSMHDAQAMRDQLENKSLVLNAVGLLALTFIVIVTGAIAISPGLGNDRIALVALAIAMVAFLVPTAESHRRNAIEAADAVDRLFAVESEADWLRIERRVPRLLPRLWPRGYASMPSDTPAEKSL